MIMATNLSPSPFSNSSASDPHLSRQLSPPSLIFISSVAHLVPRPTSCWTNKKSIIGSLTFMSCHEPECP
jgi:hypothetical protein